MKSPTRSVLHERLCLREHPALRVGVLVLALIQVLFESVSYARGRPPAPFSNFRMLGLSILFVFFLSLILAVTCFEERVILSLLALGVALELSAYFLPTGSSTLLSIQHRRAADLLISTAVAIFAALSFRRRQPG
jgi:hypothetical protein